LKEAHKANKSETFILTWAGLRGGISIALALSLPAGEIKDIILYATYVVVVFSIIVQGLTIEKLVSKLLK
jgi:CPA1 family monovalent cation:H+ antiporter